MGYIDMLDPIALDHVDYIQPFLRQVEKWELHFCIFPRKCDLTEKKLWFTFCYRGKRYIKHLGVFNTYYVGKEEFILWKIKQ